MPGGRSVAAPADGVQVQEIEGMGTLHGAQALWLKVSTVVPVGPVPNQAGGRSVGPAEGVEVQDDHPTGGVAARPVAHRLVAAAEDPAPLVVLIDAHDLHGAMLSLRVLHQHQ